MEKAFRFAAMVLSLVYSVLILPSHASASPSFRCDVHDGHTRVALTSTTAEDYMADGEIDGLAISTYENEDGVSYSAQVLDGEHLLASGVVPFLEDASLQVRHGGQTITVQCHH